ncbi:MAG: hypothetical protein ABJB97_05140, partial [Acidobacteriota bacterium]
MRKSLFIGLLVAILSVVSMFPFLKSNAANTPRHNGSTAGSRLPSATLPDYDIRVAGKGEFMDYDLNSTAGTLNAAQDNATRARVSALAEFRSTISPDKADNLRAVVNEAGAIKNLFIDGAPLSEAQSDTADRIARNFLSEHTALFALSETDVAGLALVSEDNDAGTTFLKYSQTVGGFKVFEGGVQVVVNKVGQVLSVREGFLVSERPAKLKASISEAGALAAAFRYAGKSVGEKFVETAQRATKGDTARFANPLGPDFEDVLSELNVVRVGNAGRLAWHSYAEVGPNEWYEMLVDAQTGEFLLRHNLYVFDAQGTVYTEDPG